MITLKFGGTSMGNAARISDSAAIMMSRAKEDRISVVVSAVAGVSNKLAASIEDCARSGQAPGSKPAEYAASVARIHHDIAAELGAMHAGFGSAAVITKLDPCIRDYERLLDAVSTVGECPAAVYARIMGIGELLSSAITEELLRALGADVRYVDSRECIFTSGNCAEGDPDYEKTAAALAPYRSATARVLLFPGFICNWNGTGAGLLGRNGSDFSAAIIAYALDAARAEFWSDVDGIYTADPRVVSDAILVEEMSYEEAMELSFFGSKVLHPKTLSPLSLKNIEARCLNSFNPGAKGTRIAALEKLSRAHKKPDGGASHPAMTRTVCGISCLKETAMVSVSGAGMKGRSGTAARIFSAVSHGGVSVLLITQSSSEYTISFCVRKEDADIAAEILQKEFELEIREKLINPIEAKKNCAIVSIVGDGMKQVRGVAATFFDALASSGINVHAIAQGSSERSISAVIAGEDGETAVRICHRFFFNTAQTIELFLFGTGTIGGCLLDQVRGQQQELASQKIEIKAMGIANVDKMLLDPAGVNLASWREGLESAGQPTSLEGVLDFASRIKPLNPVFVDCTASGELCERYFDILKAGMHIATPNKRANSMSMDYYRGLRTTANNARRRFLYETNVGAGLPIIDTLQNLFKSGDRLEKFAGIMSGSLSYIFGRLDEGALFSEAVLEARAKKFTEPDPRDDLSGADVARKALIIAREAGFSLELDDVKVSKALPPGFDDSGSAEDFLKNLPAADGYFAEYISRLKKEGKALRMGATIEGGVCSVGMIEVDSRHPLYSIKDGENAFVFTTARYNPIPLCVRGYGAGAAVTAAGVFGDILRTVSWNMEA